MFWSTTSTPATIATVSETTTTTTQVVDDVVSTVTIIPTSTINYLYVSISGSDATGTGSPAQPYRTISRALSLSGPNTTITVMQGIYNEQVILEKSGAANALILLQGLAGAIIDGTGVTLKAVNNAVGAAGLVIFDNVSYVTLTGFEIRNVASTKQFVALVSVEGSGNHVTIDKCNIHDINADNKNSGGHAIGCYGVKSPVGITNLTISNNQMYNLKLGQSESCTVNGNIDGYLITGNTIYASDNIGQDNIGFEKTCADPNFDYARNGIISYNCICNCSDNGNPTYPKLDNSCDGIYCDGSDSIEICYNNIVNCNIGIECASEHKGHVSSNTRVHHNLVSMCTGPGLSLGGYSKSVGSTSAVYVTNNVFFNNDTMNTGSGECQLQYWPTSVSTQPSIIENNIFYPGTKGICISSAYTGQNVQLNNNCYWTTSTKGINTLSWQFDKKSYTTFSAYQKGTSQDANGIAANPELVSNVPTSTDFHIQALSPAINKGSTALGTAILGTLDYAGKPSITAAGQINMGAYQQ